jgi:hypothetical protein
MSLSLGKAMLVHAAAKPRKSGASPASLTQSYGARFIIRNGFSAGIRSAGWATFSRTGIGCLTWSQSRAGRRRATTEQGFGIEHYLTLIKL